MVPGKLTFLDRKLLCKHLISLSEEDRRLRFGLVASDQFISKYVYDTIDNPDSQWFGFKEDGDIIAACHASIYENGDGELGCSVSEGHRNNGYAQMMFDRASTWLRSNNVTHVFMHCLSENAAMRHIAKKNYMTVVSHVGESDAEVLFEPPTPLTKIADAYLDQVALYDMLYKNTFRIFKNLMV